MIFHHLHHILALALNHQRIFGIFGSSVDLIFLQISIILEVKIDKLNLYGIYNDVYF